MAKIDFPNNPVVNEIFEAPNGQTWKWDGKSWNSISASNLSGIDVSEFQLKNQLQGTVIGDLLPLGDETIDLGSPTKRFRDLYLSGNSLTIGTSVLSVDSTGDVFVDLNGSGSLVKLSVSDISELSDSSGVLDSAGGGGGGGGGISLTDLSIGSEGVAAGDGSLSYDDTTGVFTYTPPDLSSYLTSYTETDPVFSASDAAGITNANISNWNTAHGWGDHGAAGYLTSYTETSTLDDVITRGHLTTQTAVIPFYYADQASFPNATSYHGAIAHSHADGAMYFAHGGNWVKLANDSSLTETDPVFSASDAAGITSTDISNWNTAHGWGDHSLEGYLTSETTHADVLVDGDFNSSGIMVRGSNPGDYNVIVDSSSNWNDAYGWGDHGSAGYAPSTDITDLQNQIDNITGADSALDTFQELITYIRGLDSAQDLSLIQDVADLKSDSANWDTAYSWGDHSSAGYLTSYTETDPVFSASDAAGITSTDISNWDTAHGWGDHSLEGYSKVEISDNPPSNPTAGDLWWNSNEGNLKIYYGNDTDTAGDDIWVDASAAGYSGGAGGSSSSITDGTSSVSFDSANDVVIDTDLNVNAINISGHILPSANAQFDLGNAEYKIRHLFLSDNSLRFGKDGTGDISGNYVSFGKNNLDRNVEVYTDGDTLDDLVTAVTPPTPNSVGKKGDIRVIGGFMYVCIRTAEVEDGTPNWVRSTVEHSWS